MVSRGTWDGGDGEDEGKGWFRRICRRVRRTSCGYVTRDAIIFEKAEHIRMVDGGSDE